MARPGVMFYFDVRPCLKRLTDEDKGRLFEAILDFGEFGVIPDFDGALGVAWDFIQPRIERERKAGALILSSTMGGYYTSHNRAEVAEFVRTLESRAKHTFLALRTARRFLRETAISQAEAEGQISMESL